MANPEHVEIVRQGADALAQWRADHPQEPLDLSEAQLARVELPGGQLAEANLQHAFLAEADLTQADLRAANLTGADLRGASLSQATGHALNADSADFRRADLEAADFRAANFSDADLRAILAGGVDLRVANLSRADARRAEIHQADMRRADLTETNFQDAFLQDALVNESRLINTNFTRAGLSGVDFAGAVASGVLWNDVDLSESRNLDAISHRGPSCIGIDTVYQSRGRIPAEFLRGSGVNESFISNAAGLAGKALHFHPVLLVHAEDDAVQAEMLQTALLERGIRCWRDTISAESGSPEELFRYRRGQKILFCVSQSWFELEAAGRTLQAAQMLEEKSSSEQGIAVRNWYTADFDGVLKTGPENDQIQAHQRRLVGSFTLEASQNGQLEHQLENVLNIFTAYAGVSDQATLVDQALTQIHQLMGRSERLQDGYRKLLHNDGAKNMWFDFRGKKRRSYHIRQLTQGQSMEWETASVVFERGQDFCYFCFAGAMGAQNRPPSHGFTLLVNGEATAPFNLARDERAWHSPDHTVTLLYSPHWLSRDDSSGFFYAAILKDRLQEGQPCRLGVRIRGKDSPRWFALFPEKQPVLCQADTP